MTARRCWGATPSPAYSAGGASMPMARRWPRHGRDRRAVGQTIRFRLKHRFDLLPYALSHPTNVMPVIMPERLARLPILPRLTEMVGSGPYRYVQPSVCRRAQRLRAIRALRATQPGRGEFLRRAADCAFRPGGMGDHPRPGHPGRSAAIRRVDWVEQPLMDLVPQLRRDSALKVEVVEDKGIIGFLRFNQLFPPFDNPAIRRACLKAVRQRDFMEAVVGSNAAYNDHTGVFAPGMPMASDAGMAALSGRTTWRRSSGRFWPPATRASRSSTSPSTTCPASTRLPRWAPTCCARSA